MTLFKESDFIQLDEHVLSEITHQLSHDIGNPLTSIITYGSLIQQAQNLDISKDKISSYADTMLNETWKISILMEKFVLLISRKNNQSNTKLTDLYSKIMSRYKTRYNLGAFDIDLLGFEHDKAVCGDIEQISSMLCEMLVNAASEIKFISKETEVDYSLQLLAQDNNDGTISFIIKNPTEKHSFSIEELMTPGKTDHSTGKATIGIGLPAIYNSAKRFKGNFKIELQTYTNPETKKENLTFISTLSLPTFNIS